MYVHPRRGDHQGGTAVSIFGAGFAFNGTDPSLMVRRITTHSITRAPAATCTHRHSDTRPRCVLMLRAFAALLLVSARDLDRASP